MTRLPILSAWCRAPFRLAGVAAFLLAHSLAAADPDTLPLPRTRPAPHKLLIPADDATPVDAKAKAPQTDAPPATKPSTGKEPAPTNGTAEVPLPEAKPGRAPDPPGGGKADVDKEKDAKKDEKKKDAPPPDGRCDRCGSCDCVRKVCVPKMTEKEIKKVCWDSRCEDFCVPGPSVWCGKACKKDDCGCWTHAIWKPTCAEVRTRVVPVRKETKRKVPAVEWKVEERCACCRRTPCDLAAKPATSDATGGKPNGGQATK